MPKGDNAGAKGKLNERFIEALTEVVNENILFATDEELVDEINALLEPENQITYDGFSNWKRGTRQSENDLYPLFVRLIKKALLKEKKRLLKLLEKDPQGWQRYAWILERKFDEWNIKIKSEVKQEVNISQLPNITIKNGS